MPAKAWVRLAPTRPSMCAPLPFGASCLTAATFGVPAGLDEMVLPMSLALPHLQPLKRKRNKPGVKEEDALDESKVPRVSEQAS
jgi:hypothetical protein